MCEIFWVRQSGDEAGYESWDEEQTRAKPDPQKVKDKKIKIFFEILIVSTVMSGSATFLIFI